MLLQHYQVSAEKGQEKETSEINWNHYRYNQVWKLEEIKEVEVLCAWLYVTP